MKRDVPWIVLVTSIIAAAALAPACDGEDGSASSTTATTTTTTTSPTTSGGACSEGEWRLCGAVGVGGAGGAGGAGSEPNSSCVAVQVCGASREWSACEGVIVPSEDPCDSKDCDGLSAADPTSCLAEEALVRYFIDEADSGDSITTLQDAAGSELHLSIVGLPVPQNPGDPPTFGFVEANGQRGLRWSSLDMDTNAKVPVAGTAIPTSLTDRLTIEAVVDIFAVDHVDGSFVAYIGNTIAQTALGLRVEGRSGTTDPETVSLLWNNGSQEVAKWRVDVDGRCVLHVVAVAASDSSAMVTLYHNGKRVEDVLVNDPPTQPLAYSPGAEMVLGNAYTGSRSFVGKLYYAALYASALSEASISRHAEILRRADDGPGM